jgi:hypothetical protein
VEVLLFNAFSAFVEVFLQLCLEFEVAGGPVALLEDVPADALLVVGQQHLNTIIVRLASARPPIACLLRAVRKDWSRDGRECLRCLII